MSVTANPPQRKLHSRQSAPSNRFKILSDLDVGRLPRLEWLIAGVLPVGAFAVLYGASGIGKSFVALDLAHAIGEGLSWQGRATRKGSVLYVAAEGANGLRLRVGAWKKERQRDRTNVQYLPEAVQLHESKDIEDLIAQINGFAERPALIVIDTLARCFVGGEESSSKDMGRLVAAVDRLRAETDAAVLLVHHSGKDPTKAERGSSALAGAADVRMRLNGNSKRLALRCDKQKDGAPPFDPIGLRLKPIAVQSGESCVVESAIADTSDDEPRTENERRALTVLESFGRPVSSVEWQKASVISGLKKRTFYRLRDPVGGHAPDRAVG